MKTCKRECCARLSADLSNQYRFLVAALHAHCNLKSAYFPFVCSKSEESPSTTDLFAVMVMEWKIGGVCLTL
jgi:hypothetical protein